MVKASELVKKQKEKEEKKKKMYEIVYQNLEKKIQLASNLNHYRCSFNIPEVIITQPNYRYIECVDYVDKKLKKNGFRTLWEENIVIIDWIPE